MKFSFVIPTYNNKVLLRNTLEALNNQRNYGYGDYEVIVVDDGSTDDTYNYIHGVNKNYMLKYLFLERNENSCRSKTRNCGWKNAGGEIVAFIDSDIIVKEDYLLQLERCFSINSDIFVVGNRIMLDEAVSADDIRTGNIFSKFHFDGSKYQWLEFRYFLYEVSSYNSKAIMCSWIHTYSCNLAVSKKWLLKIGGFDENFRGWGMEDVEVGYSLFKSGAQMIINSKLDVLHQYHGERNDLIVEKRKIPEYEKNIDYFLEKHPQALRMNKTIAYKFLEGEVSSNKVLMDLPYEKIEIRFKEKTELENVKHKILELKKNKNIRPIVYDYVEDTDLDIWVQLLDYKTSNPVRYYPMSKRLNIHKMMDYIETEKVLQRARA